MLLNGTDSFHGFSSAEEVPENAMHKAVMKTASHIQRDHSVLCRGFLKKKLKFQILSALEGEENGT